MLYSGRGSSIGSPIVDMFRIPVAGGLISSAGCGIHAVIQGDEEIGPHLARWELLDVRLMPHTQQAIRDVPLGTLKTH